MKTLKLFAVVAALLIGSQVYSQDLPSSYESLFNEIVSNFDEIRGSNSLNDGDESLRLLSDDKIIVRMKHKRKVKTLTFVKKADEEGSKFWVSANQLTTDMVNKFEEDLSEVLDNMLELSHEEAKQD